MINDNLTLLLLVFAAAGAVQFGLVRKQITSIADPLTYFVVASAFSLALACFASDDPWLTVRIFAYFACFYLGLNFVSGRTRASVRPLQIHADVRLFRAVVLTCCLVYVGFNALIWMQSGFILFSDDPSLQKSDAYAGGFGFIRRFNWSVGTFVLVASLYWWLWERSVVAALAVAVTILTALTGGGKGALLPAVFGIGLFIARPFETRKGQNNAVRLRRLIPLLLVIACVPVAIVLVAEHGTAGEAFDAFVVRLFSFGDVLLYWGQEPVRHHFAGLGPVDYFRNTFGSILGALRLIDYDIPIGNQLIQYVLPFGTDLSDSLGPNLPFYVRGEMYFGIVVSILYSTGIGVIFGLLRRLFMNYRGSSLLMYSILSFIVVNSATIPTDEGLAIGQAFDFIIIFFPLYVALSHFIPRWKTGQGKRLHGDGAGQSASTHNTWP